MKAKTGKADLLEVFFGLFVLFLIVYLGAFLLPIAFAVLGKLFGLVAQCWWAGATWAHYILPSVF